MLGTRQSYQIVVVRGFHFERVLYSLGTENERISLGIRVRIRVRVWVRWKVRVKGE